VGNVRAKGKAQRGKGKSGNRTNAHLLAGSYDARKRVGSAPAKAGEEKYH